MHEEIEAINDMSDNIGKWLSIINETLKQLLSEAKLKELEAKLKASTDSLRDAVDSQKQ